METVIIEKKAVPKKAYRNDLLKLLALATMLVDHIGYMYFPKEVLFRIIGRLAFPIFAYQIAIGYSHTRNLKKYTLRLSLFALLTQLPYSFFNPELQFNPLHFNVLFTFVIAIGMLRVYDLGISSAKEFFKTKRIKHLLCSLLLLALTLIIIILPEVMSFVIKDFYIEYGLLGLGLVLLFHIFEEKAWAAVLSIALLYIFHGYYRVALWNSAYSAAQFWSNLTDYRFVWNQLDVQNGLSQLERYFFNAWGVLALIPIFTLENLNTGWLRLNKYVGYVFYPAHMTLLIVIAIALRL